MRGNMVLPTPLQAFSGMPKAAATTEKQTIVDGEKMTGAEALVRSLEDLGVKDVFGVPGGAILPVYDAINDETSFRFVLMRHEQAAGHAAEGYAVSTGQVGVCIVTSGPGATNMITPIADANMDSVPMVVITGQVGVNAIGTDAFQEADIVGATYPVVKHSYLVTRAQDIPRVLAEAHYVARSGRPGPVVVDVTKTAQTGDMYYSWPQRMILPGYNPTTKAHGRVLSDAAKLFEQSYRPVLYVGGGAARSDAGKLVQELAEVTNAPIVTTLPARGVVPDSDPKVLGMLGMHGTIAATGAVQRCDLLVAIGARFDDRVTGKLDAFAPGARVIHIDIDPAEIGKNRQPDVPIVGDVATVLKDLIPEIKREQAVHGKPDTSHWWEIINDWREKYPIKWDEPTDGSLAPQWVIKQLSDLADSDTIWITGTPHDSNFTIGIVLLLVTLFIVLNLIHSRDGRAIMAIRDNTIAAESVGIHITKYKLMAFSISAALAGVAGVLYAHNLSTLTALPKNFGYNMSIMILVFVVLGGIGNIRGSIIASVILTLLPELLRGLNDYRMLIYSIVLIVMMLFNWAPKCIEWREKVAAGFKSKKSVKKEAE